MKRRFVWAATIVVAALAAACNGAQDSAGLSPTAASTNGGQASANGSQGGLSAAQTAELTASCVPFGSGDTVTSPGGPPPAGAPGTVVTGPGGFGPGGPDGTVTTPGTPPPGPATGAHLAIGGALEGLAGGCPTLTFTIGGNTVRTNATTSFGSGACALLKNSDRVGAMGSAQADGSIVASCVASGLPGL